MSRLLITQSRAKEIFKFLISGSKTAEMQTRRNDLKMDDDGFVGQKTSSTYKNESDFFVKVLV